tara:strand:- start:54 stop:548 length:495 start_codon:yes stop_codon:yes gene_type:complete
LLRDKRIKAAAKGGGIDHAARFQRNNTRQSTHRITPFILPPQEVHGRFAGDTPLVGHGLYIRKRNDPMGRPALRLKGETHIHSSDATRKWLRSGKLAGYLLLVISKRGFGRVSALSAPQIKDASTIRHLWRALRYVPHGRRHGKRAAYFPAHRSLQKTGSHFFA